MAADGYCDAGVHYVGDEDSCWRCRLWKVQQTEEKVFYAAADAHLLAAALDIE